MTEGERVQGVLIDLLREPESSASSIPTLVSLLDHDDRHVRVSAAWGLCLVVSSNPGTIDRVREQVRSEANSAEAVVVQQWLRTGSPPEPEAETDRRQSASNEKPDRDESPTNDEPAETAARRLDRDSPEFGEGVVQEGRFAVPLAETRLEQFEIIERAEANDHRRTYVGLATIGGTERAVWLRSYPTPDGVVEESFRDVIGAAFDRWNRISRYDHVLNVYDWGRRPRPWVVLDYAARPLYAIDQPESDEGLRLALDVAYGLAHAHDHGLVHGSLDRASIALVPGDSDRLAAVGEFGFGAAYRSVDAPTPLDTRYGAPEQFDRAFGSIDRRTDVFHLGSVLYTLLTGSPPRESGLDRDSLDDLPEPPVPSTVDGSLPDPVDSIVAKAMAPRKIARYESADAFAADLRELVTDRRSQ